MLRDPLPRLNRMARAIGTDLHGSTVSPDGVYELPRQPQGHFQQRHDVHILKIREDSEQTTKCVSSTHAFPGLKPQETRLPLVPDVSLPRLI
ncbi:hypothetical protein OKW43_006741 [Paraburkholderia sp. WC7.3g]|uniref:hypothetical protein n=1 Tax=Paraburkholderia sp. WC7.3g TaxID=2991070 RepID=UPI003D19EB14